MWALNRRNIINKRPDSLTIKKTILTITPVKLYKIARRNEFYNNMTPIRLTAV